ncbi:MAG: transglutaminase domain-containing protein, partial [Lachnospiraceae bacterium]|nr:transglutaminase domain-containing protein [Lachnospiraceae bacterium]
MKRKSRQVKEKIIMILLTICIMLWCAPKQDAMAQDPTDGQEETETLDVRKPTGLEELQVEIFEEEDFDGIEPADGEEDIDTYVIYSSDAADYWKSMGTDYIYSQLSAQEQKVWDTLETYCIRYAESDEDCNMIYPNVYLMDVSSEEATNFVHVFYYSHPQYFFLSNSIGLSSSGNQIRPILYIDEAFRDGVTRKAAVAEFKAKIDSWASEIRACDTDVAKEKKAIEILADNTIYSDESPLNQSAYSLVCEGKTVCAGYCATFAIVMNMAGVETQVITGNANGGHGWNTIKVHGVWYVVDPTWADQNDEQKPGYFYGIAYKYFNRSDATISADRTRYPMWEKYYKPANYDSGTSSLSYVDPYFTEGNYKYFTVNNNTNLAVLYALPIEALNGAAISAAPETILHESKTYNKYMLAQVWEEPKVTLCVGSDYDCSELLSEQKDAASWLTEDTTVATVNNGVVTAKASGTTKIIATVGTSQFSFEITVRNHDFAQPTFEWAEDGSSCKATRVCTYDEAHKESKDCTIRSIVLRQATCCAKGVTRYTANAYDINNRKDITDIEIDKNYHAGSTTKKNEKRPTCTEEGYTGDTYCSSCNEKISSGTSIPAIGHYMIREVSKKVEATCIAAGKEAVMGCARCEYTEGGATIEKKAH